MTQHIITLLRTHLWRTRLVALLAFGIALALAGCASISVSGSGAAGTSTSSVGTPEASSTQGTLAGDVVAGPTCPVERADGSCAPKAVPNREVEISGAKNAVVATATTDSKGHFSVALAPGTYTVTVPMKSGQVGMRQVNAGTVSVTAGQVTTIKVMLDTGIR